MRSFWYLIKDHDNKIFDILGPISNDDSYNVVISDVQRKGFNVNAESLDLSKAESEICIYMENRGYKRDRELYRRVMKKAQKAG